MNCLTKIILNIVHSGRNKLNSRLETATGNKLQIKTLHQSALFEKITKFPLFCVCTFTVT